MPVDDRLDSWKEIAAYLGREIRTVQGWEKNEGLPIHRHQHSKQGSVFAFRSELDTWREARKISADAPVPAEAAPSSRKPPAWTIIAAMCVVIAGISGYFVWKNRVATSDIPSSLVVLPFADISAQHDQDYFVDGLTEEIIDALSRVPNLRVVARTSAFAFKGKANDIREIGKQLDVAAVLEGSVRKAGDKLRITAQLNRVSDGTHLWSRTYDRDLRDVFDLQHEISQAIANELRAGNVPARRGTADLEAYQRYQEGRYFFNQQEPASYHKAIERYQQAIMLDPKFALAYAGLADAWAYLAENTVEAPREVMPKAKEAAEKAVALDEGLAEAHTSLGMVKLDYEYDRDGAQREFQRALQINPGSGWVHHWYAHSLETQGKLDDAMKEMRLALSLDPLSLVFYWDVSSEFLEAGRFDEALTTLHKAEELFPHYWLLEWFEIEAYSGKGDLASVDRVVTEMKNANVAMANEPSFMAVIGIADAREGRKTEAQQILDRIEGMRKTRYVEPYSGVELSVALGDGERARMWFARMKEERSTLLMYLPLAARYFDPHRLIVNDAR